jgi:hypothetical protein
MNNAQDEVNQTFWTAATGVLKDVVWEQFIAVAIVLTVVRLISLLMKRDTSWISSCALAICGSFFLWPHIFNLYLSMIDSRDFGSPLASLRPGHFSNPLQFMQRELILRPAFFNGPSIFLALLVVLIWAMTKRGNGRIRWLGAFGLVMILPLAWYADCFNTGPD